MGVFKRDKSFIFENVALSKQVSAGFASNFTNSISVYVKYPGESDFVYAGNMPFATTQSWGVDRQGICYSTAVYIPEGASVKVIPTADVDLDYFRFTNNPLGTEGNVPANTVLAKNASLTGAEKSIDMMSTIGEVVTMDAPAEQITFVAPTVLPLYNNAEGAYSANVRSAGNGSNLGKTVVSKTINADGVLSEPYPFPVTVTLI